MLLFVQVVGVVNNGNRTFASSFRRSHLRLLQSDFTVTIHDSIHFPLFRALPVIYVCDTHHFHLRLRHSLESMRKIIEHLSGEE